MKKVKFFTLGCKVNQYETQGIRENFLRAGWQENNASRADIYVINTCTVTHQADRESRRLIRKAWQSHCRAQVIVTGCLAESDAEQILRISPRIRIVPNQQKHLFLESLSGAKPGSLSANNNAAGAGNLNASGYLPLQISKFKDHQRVFIKIQDGCDNFCAYCKVPLVRGRSRSRSLKQILTEVERLTDCGYKEVVLTGICLGDYHYRDFTLVDALSHLTKIRGNFRIRLSSIEPQLLSDKLIAQIADSERLCPHLHIPLQSGDDGILSRMNRPYTQKKYLSLITKIRKSINNVAVTTDALVGFPGESQNSFENTLRCIKEVLPLRTHIFSFSSRPGTKAAELSPRTEPQTIRHRVNLLKHVASQCSYKFRRNFLGKRLQVLIESQPDKTSGLFCGYSENYIRVNVEDTTARDVNKVLAVKVTRVESKRTMGRGLSL